jgi:DNA-binding transcriptional LysR family regulator
VPRLAAAIRTPKDLITQVLIESDNKRVRWASWFDANGLTPPPPGGMRFDRSFLAIAAAVDGLGVALESTLLAEREIARGELVKPLADKAKDVRYVGHYLVYPRAARQRQTLRQFTAWIAAELGLDLGPDPLINVVSTASASRTR